jgi:nucleoid-associated protein YgaU
MGAATILPVDVVGAGADGSEAAGERRLTRRELEARKADAARRRRGARVSAGRALFAGDGQLRLVPRFELAGDDLVANDDLASLRRSRSAAPHPTARPVGPAAAGGPGGVVRPAARRPASPALRTAHPVAAPAAPAVRPVRPAARPAGRHVARPVPSVEAATRPSTGSVQPATAATYRRRRLVAGALVLGVLLAGSWALGVLGGGSLTASEARSPSSATAAVSIGAVEPVSRRTYVVQPGDTLWSIARALTGTTDPGADVRPTVDALAAERHGRPLEVGETIVLP